MRRRTGLFAPVAVAAVLALLVVVPAAPAAVRYATPFGSNADPCNPTACNLPKAVNGAHDGDEVILEPGTYKPSTAIDVNHAIVVGGQPGAAFPVVQLDGQNIFFEVENAGATVHDLRFERFGEALGRTLEIAAGTVERVFAVAGEEAGGACLISSGVLRDSVCAGFAEVSAFGGGDVHVVLRNDTFGPTLVGAAAGANLTADAANVIMHSEEPGQPDLTLDVNTGSTGAISLTDSSYATVSTSPSAGTGYSYTPPGTDGNQTAPPRFVDAAAGDFHELPGSPTVDAGLADALVGPSDLDGVSRALPSCLGGAAVPDIGAYELAPTAACPQPPSVPPSSSSSPPALPPPPTQSSPRHLQVRVGCPKGAKPGGCRLALQVVAAKPPRSQGKGKRGGAAKPVAESAVARVKLAAGHSALVTLTPKPEFAARLESAAKLLVREVETAKGATHTTYRRLGVVG